MSSLASSFSVYVPSSTPSIVYKRGALHVRCGNSKAEREEARIKSEIGTLYTKSRKVKLKGNLPEAIKICEKKGEDLGFMITSSDWKMLLEKSAGGFVDDVYAKYTGSKHETQTKSISITKKKVKVLKMKNRKKKPAVENKRSDGGGKGKAGLKGSDGNDMKNAEVNEGGGTGEAGEEGSDGDDLKNAEVNEGGGTGEY